MYINFVELESIMRQYQAHQTSGSMEEDIQFFYQIRRAIQNYVDFCYRIFISQPITSYLSKNKFVA